jgi:S-adenosylmethionine-diacylglycerol 3-amino-3-carboxypropyl transferase
LSRELIESRVSFDIIRYANCWEDADILVEALQPSKGKRILSIASAGDNALALLAEGAEIVAADLSVPQLACVELRRAAFRQLAYEPLLAFLGIRPAENRLNTFDRLRRDLTPASLDFWRNRPDLVARGIIHAGKFEAYFGKFRRWVLPLIHSQRTINTLLEPKDFPARQAFWQIWNNRRWRLLFRMFFSRCLMGKLGRDPEFFRYVEGSVSQRLMDRARHGLVDLPTHANPFLDYIVHGNFPRTLPRYLRPEHFDSIRSGFDRLQLHHGSIEQAGQQYRGDGFDGFNLSDIFEYLDPPSARDLYADLIPLARPGARLAYWNTLVARGAPDDRAEQVRPLRNLSRELFARDLAFFYGDFHVDEVQIAAAVATKPLTRLHLDEQQRQP